VYLCVVSETLSTLATEQDERNQNCDSAMMFEICEALQTPTLNSFSPAHGRATGILIIDDDLGIRSLLSLLLQDEGYFVFQAGDSEEAASVWGQHRDLIDVVLCDFNLPDAEGPEIVAPFQQEQPELKVIFMSGMVTESVPKHGLNVYRFLEKPFNPRSLSVSIRGALNERVEAFGK
jgi:DNA-binding NtrC family response regulator